MIFDRSRLATVCASFYTLAMSSTQPTARLALEDGSVFHGQAFGYTDPHTTDGEVCFNTAMAGYQEVLTDPSYAGQIVTMTYPLIGNTGVNDLDLESDQTHVRGFVVRELAQVASNYRSIAKLEKFLVDAKVTGLTGIDTRALTRKLRIEGALKGIISTDPNPSDAELVKLAQQSEGLVGVNMVQKVSRSESMAWDQDLGEWAPIQGAPARTRVGAPKRKVVALDCGAKLNILRNLTDQGCEVMVMPFDASADEIMAQNPDGLFVSNGPGDPSAVTQTIETLKTLTKEHRLPTFGICLGHQLLALAIGAETFKLKFGHRGANHPIQNLDTQKVEITSQNHGFAVETRSLEAAGGEATHLNLNDRTLAGFRHKELPIFAVQYHPEASPGPHDARYLFDCFAEMFVTGQSPTGAEMDRSQRARNRPIGHSVTIDN